MKGAATEGGLLLEKYFLIFQSHRKNFGLRGGRNVGTAPTKQRWQFQKLASRNRTRLEARSFVTTAERGAKVSEQPEIHISLPPRLCFDFIIIEQQPAPFRTRTDTVAVIRSEWTADGRAPYRRKESTA